MLIDIDTSLLDDKECKKCPALCIYCENNNTPDIQKIYDVTNINLFEIANSKTLSIENKNKINSLNIKLQDLQEFKTHDEITSCTLGFLWLDLMSKINPSGNYKFICKHKYPTCDGSPGFWCFYHFL